MLRLEWFGQEAERARLQRQCTLKGETQNIGLVLDTPRKAQRFQDLRRAIARVRGVEQGRCQMQLALRTVGARWKR